MQFKCPTCERILTVPDERAGEKTFCPICKQKLLIPAPPAPKPQPINKTVLGVWEMPVQTKPVSPTAAEEQNRGDPYGKDDVPLTPSEAKDKAPPRPKPKFDDEDDDRPSRPPRKRRDADDYDDDEFDDPRRRRRSRPLENDNPASQLDVAAFVCGLVAFVLSCVPFIAWPMSILGFSFGVYGLVNRKDRASWQATSGLILAIVAFVITSAIFLFFFEQEMRFQRQFRRGF